MLVPYWVYSQQGTKVYSVKDGLPSSQIYRMTQDLDGAMWFATNRGLSKFDGFHFTNYTNEDGLANQDVWELSVDDDNNVWFFSKSKYQGYIKNGKIKFFKSEDNEGLSPNSFFYLDKQYFLFTPTDKSAYHFLEGNRWKKAPIDPEIERMYTEGIFTHVYHAKQKQLVLFANEKAFFYPTHLLPKENKERENMAFKSGSLSDTVLYLFRKYGFHIVDVKNKTSKYFSSKALFGHAELHRATKFDWVNGQLHLSSKGQLVIFNSDFSVKDHYHFEKRFPDNVNSYLDRDGNFWYNNQSGLVFESAEKRAAQNYFVGKRITKLGSIDGKLYAGDHDGNFDVFDEDKNEFVPVFRDIGTVYRIKSDENTLVTSNQIYRNDNGQWKSIILKMPTWLKNFKDFTIFENNFTSISSHGLSFYDRNSSESQLITKTNIHLFGKFLDRLYVGGSNGLFVYKNNKLIPIFDEEVHLPILSFLQFGKYLLIGTEGLGIFCFDGKKMYRIQSTKNLVVNTMMADATTKDGLYAATQKGIIKLKLKGDYFRESIRTNTYTTNDGLLSNDTYDFFVKGNDLFTATEHGISRIDISNKHLYRKVSVVFLDSKEKLEVTAKDRKAVRIPFSIKDFVKSGTSVYLYRLLPEQKKWLETSGDQIVLHNLSAGTHILEVKSTTLHNVESVSRKTIVVQPYWWEIQWIRILIAAVLVVLLFFGIRKTIRNVRKKAVQKSEQEKRASELQLLALRSQMNPHFVHNSLNAIQYYIQRHDVELSENYLTKFSRLIRMFFDYSEKHFIHLQNEIELLENYLQIEQLRFEDKISYTISCTEQLRLRNPLLPSMVFQPIVENAVNHGLFNKLESGKIEICFTEVEQNRIEVHIEDDGIGYNKSIKMKTESMSNNRSSSTILKDRIKLLNRSGQKIDYEIKDKSELSLKEEGTIVVIRIDISLQNEQR